MQIIKFIYRSLFAYILTRFCNEYVNFPYPFSVVTYEILLIYGLQV